MGGGASEPAANPADEAEPERRIEPSRALEESSEPEALDSGAETLAEKPEKMDSKKIAKGTTSLDVEIFGGVYHVRGKQDPEYLQRLARVVDGKMREISHHVGVVDSGKIAILAALNLADELLQCNHQQEGERVEMMEKVEELTGVLNDALTD